MSGSQIDDPCAPSTSLQLDIVGFLAILGEGSVLEKAQVQGLSRWALLPRIMSAPHSLLRPTRPMRLEASPGHVVGVFSRSQRDSVNHLGNVVCLKEKLPPYSVSCVEIKRTRQQVPVTKDFGIQAYLAIIGFVSSVILLVLSIRLKDGMSLIATVDLSLLSSLAGLCNRWTLELPIPKSGRHVPSGDVVIRYPQGSFLLVRCPEDIARELFFHPEDIKYVVTSLTTYRALALCGTLMLMAGVICLANATVTLQIAWAVTYFIIGSLYWSVATLPDRLFWDASCYTVSPECFSDSRLSASSLPSEGKSYMDALWKAIAITQSIDWVLRSEACPDTEPWRDWLQVAERASREVRLLEDSGVTGIKTWELPFWNPRKCLSEILSKQAKSDREDTYAVFGSMTEQMSGAALPDYDDVLSESSALRYTKGNAADRSPEQNGETYWWQTGINYLKHTIRPSTPRGYRRIEWSCPQCGDAMYGDYDNSHPAALDKLETRLRQIPGMPQPSIHLTEVESYAESVMRPNEASLSYQSSKPGSSNTQDQGTTTKSEQGRSPSTPGNKKVSDSASSSRSIRAELSPTVSLQTETLPNRFFELCVNVGQLEIRLGEIDVTNICTDAELFAEIDKRYKEIRGHRMRRLFLRPVNINFVQFNVQERHRVGIYDKPLALPPAKEVSDGRYHYYECPLEVKPPIDHRTFLHLMNKHKHGATTNVFGMVVPRGSIFLERLPKKLNDSMCAAPTSPIQFGWGVHIIEGPNKTALSCATAVVIALSFVISVLYAVFAKSQESGFGIGQWLVAVGAAGTTALYYHWTET